MQNITLATLKDATEQQVFDQVVAHLRKQGEKSTVAGSNQCKYRTTRTAEDGQAVPLMCAAGCLISDEEYNPRMDSSDMGSSWESLVAYGVIPDHHKNLIQRLQNTHDGSNPEFWEADFAHIADVFGLTIPLVEQGEV